VYVVYVVVGAGGEDMLPSQEGMLP
jgi:hypothetical protein